MMLKFIGQAIKWSAATVGAVLVLTIVLGLSGVLDQPKGKSVVPQVITAAASAEGAAAPASTLPAAAHSAPGVEHVAARDGSTARYIWFGSIKSLIVWRDEASMQRGFKIAFAGGGMKDLDLVAPLIACGVAAGDKAIVDEEGEHGVSVLILDGKSHGCEGWVPASFVHEEPPPAP